MVLNHNNSNSFEGYKNQRFLYEEEIHRSMKKTGGARRKTRSLFRKNKSEKGKTYISKYLQSFKIGTKVKLSFEPAMQGGTYHHVFYGKHGTIKGKQGRCYEVLIKDGSKQKTLIVHPAHLKGG